MKFCLCVFFLKIERERARARESVSEIVCLGVCEREREREKGEGGREGRREGGRERETLPPQNLPSGSCLYESELCDTESERERDRAR